MCTELPVLDQSFARIARDQTVGTVSGQSGLTPGIHENDSPRDEHSGGLMRAFSREFGSRMENQEPADRLHDGLCSFFRRRFALAVGYVQNVIR